MDCSEILEAIYKQALTSLDKKDTDNSKAYQKIDSVARCPTNRASIRLLMSCLLAKIHNPNIDPRNPYTEIKSKTSFSGRLYDEKYLTNFIQKFNLPCNPTTAFLTPALRNMDKPLTKDVVIVGKPREVYVDTLDLLDLVAKNKIHAEPALRDAIRVLIKLRNENDERLASLIKGISKSSDISQLSVENIVKLLEQHLDCKNSSRLPVLIVSSAYAVASKKISEKVRTLNKHNSADKQTGAVGDVEITLENESEVITCYEMKQKQVILSDIHAVFEKIKKAPKLDNYIFITTEDIDPVVQEFCQKSYATTGIEIAILDCIGFIRHFLHLFHRLRMDFLNEYQKQVLAEPASAVPQTLKEAFLALRRSAEEG